MGGDCLEEGLLPSRVRSTEFESGGLTGTPDINGFILDCVALELTVPAPLDCVLSGIGKPEELEKVDCTETLRGPLNWS